MVDLVVNASFDYSSSALLDITRIKFTVAGAYATFDASQFDGLAIHDDLVIRGAIAGANNGLIIDGGGVDASAWRFNFWDRDQDYLTFNGTTGADRYVGSRMKDVISGGQGSDTFNTSDGAGDEFYGEGGKDYFRYKPVIAPVTDTIDGGGNTDRLSVLGTGTFDFTGASIVSVEELKFGNSDQTVILNYDQIFPFLSGSINAIIGSGGASTLEIHGTVSFGNITVTNWTEGVDLFRIVGTSGQDLLFGSTYGDELIGGGGNDHIEAGDGNDTVVIDVDAPGAYLSGDGGVDTLLFAGQSQDYEQDLTTTAILGFERLVFAGTTHQFLLLSDQVFTDNALTEVVGDEHSNQLWIYGNTVDLNGITFTNWDAIDDWIHLYGSGDDHFDTSSLVTRDLAVVYGGLADVRLGDGYDEIVLHGQLLAGSILDGGADGLFGDTLSIASDAPPVVDLSVVTISDIETLKINSGYNGTVILTGDQIGGASLLQTVIGTNPGVVTLNVVGANVDLSSVDMAIWDFEDFIVIDGTDGDDTLIGTSETDTFNGGLGRDTITVEDGDTAYGDGANDTFLVAGNSHGIIDSAFYGGGGLSDRIVVTAQYMNIGSSLITGVEELEFRAGTGTSQIVANAANFGALGSIQRVIGASGTQYLSFFDVQTMDLSPVVFDSWNDAQDVVSVFGAIGATNIVTSAHRDVVTIDGIDDVVNTGAGDDDVSIEVNLTGSQIDAGAGSGDKVLLSTRNLNGLLDISGSMLSGFEYAEISDVVQNLQMDEQTLASNQFAQILGWATLGQTLTVSGTDIDLNGINFDGWYDDDDRLVLAAPGLAGDVTYDTSTLFVRTNAYVGAGLANIHLGERDDFFTITGQPLAGSVLDGGTQFSRDDLILTQPGGTIDFTDVTLVDIEGLTWSQSGTAILRGDQIGGSSGLSYVQNLSASPVTLKVVGSSVDLTTSMAFVNWGTLANIIEIDGTDGADTLVGSIYTDIIAGGLGDDIIALSGHDIVKGQNNNDTFTLAFGGQFNGEIFGGTGTADKVEVDSAGGLFGATIVDVEILSLLGAGTTVTQASQFGGSGFSEVMGSLGLNTLQMFGQLIDLGGITFTDWDGAFGDQILLSRDTYDLVGNPMTVVGSDQAEQVDAFNLADQFSLNGGNDRVTIMGGGFTFFQGSLYPDPFFSTGGSLDGGAGTDTLVAMTSCLFAGESISVTNFEILKPAAGGYSVIVSDDLIGGTTSLLTVDGAEMTTNALIGVYGDAIDLSPMTFQNWHADARLILQGTDGVDSITGSDENDLIYGGGGGDVIEGGNGSDTLSYEWTSYLFDIAPGQVAVGVTVRLNTGTTAGGDADGDTISGIENLIGTNFDDSLTGDGGDNDLNGLAGADTLTGGNGTDQLHGGHGDDTFSFSATAHSGLGALSDIIADFSQSVGNDDVIRLSQIDAIESTAGVDDSFTYIGQDAFSAEGQIRATQSGTRTIIQINTSGTDDAEMRIILENFTATNLTAADFVL